MSRFEHCFNALAAKGEKALGVYLTVGDPSLELSAQAADAAVRAGADFLELGVPFSDPSADGPTIQHAMERALARGTSLRDVLRVAKDLRQRHAELPVLLFGYANPFFRAQRAGWLRPALKDADVDGVLLVDVPPEHGADFASLDVDIIRLLGPNATPERRRVVAKAASGFIYLVAFAGVTGAAAQTSAAALSDNIKAVRKLTALPLCVGFGVRTGADAQRVAERADGVIAGSVFVDLLQQPGGVRAVGDKVRELKGALAR